MQEGAKTGDTNFYYPITTCFICWVLVLPLLSSVTLKSWSLLIKPIPSTCTLCQHFETCRWVKKLIEEIIKTKQKKPQNKTKKPHQQQTVIEDNINDITSSEDNYYYKKIVSVICAHVCSYQIAKIKFISY